MTQAVDSVSGTITDGYDNLDRLTSETTPQGSISYGYDAASRRANMQVAGQTELFYTYDNANRLTQIAQGTSNTGFGYDNANRRTSLTLPGGSGITFSYGYDNDSRLTSITYQYGSTTLGSLTYSYDQDGRRTQVGGSFARTGLPGAVSSTTFDAANELTNWDGTAPRSPTTPTATWLPMAIILSLGTGEIRLPQSPESDCSTMPLDEGRRISSEPPSCSMAATPSKNYPVVR